jgi:hypothetical protein
MENVKLRDEYDNNCSYVGIPGFMVG